MIERREHVVILGQGIAGLSAGYMLGEMGYNVSIIGRDMPALGGVQLAPNGLSALEQIGLLEAIMPASMPLNSIIIKSMHRRSELGEIKHQNTRPYVGIARQDILTIFRKKIKPLPLMRIINGNIKALNITDITAQIILEDGQLISADQIIAADGANGFGRAYVAGANAHISTPYRAMRAEIDAGLLARHFSRPHTQLILGDGCHFVSYPIAGGTRVNAVLCAPERALGGNWTSKYFSRNALFRGIDNPSITWINTPLLRTQSLAVWRRHHVTLIGDAAHIMPPHLAQGAGQAFEDIACLKAALTSLPLSEALDQMVQKRTIQTAKIAKKAALSGHIMRLPGPAGRLRNLFLDLAGPHFLERWLEDVWQPL